MKRIVSFALVLMLVIGMLAGCGSKAESADAAASGSTLNVVLPSIGNNLDPSVINQIDISNIVRHVYDNLLEVDMNFVVQPGVITSWEQPDALTYVLTVGEGFKFHNGEDLEMEDVLYSLTRLENIAQTADLFAKMDSITADGNNVVIKVKEANSGFIRDLTEVPVLNKSYCEEVGEAYANAPIGTGPYTLKEFVPGNKAVLTAWADYPGEKAAIDTIIFQGIEEASTAYMAVEAGDADFSRVDATDYERAQANEKLTFFASESTSTAFVSMNTQAAPFDNVNVRKAMAHAFNTEGYLSVKGENFFVIDSMFPPMTDNYYAAPNTVKYDLAQAKALLEAEGYNEANPLTFEIALYRDDPVMVAYQADLASIGVKVSLVNQEFGVFLDNMANQNFQMLTGSWGDTTGNPLTAAECYWSGSFGSQNISFFENAECDELYNTAKTSADLAEVKAACQRIQEIAWEEVPMFPTFGRTEAYVYNKALTGCEIYPSGILSFRNAKLG